MRGLAFPQASVSHRESSNEYDTPAPPNTNDIPIDPALGGQVISPETVEVNNDVVMHEPSSPLAQSQFSPQDLYMAQYDRGPQGDPFAPPPPAYFPPPDLIQQTAPPPKPVRKKRKPRREEECGFCQGNDTKNKRGEPEQMLTCHECGRSGHPTCMELESANVEALRSYLWKCIECKNCEICEEKGDDSRILFCDSCDRGWHMDCLEPPIEEPPTGKWYCPQCPQPEWCEDETMQEVEDEEQEADDNSDTIQEEAVRDSSVASTSNSYIPPVKIPNKGRGRGKGKGRGRGRVIALPESEPEEVEIEVRTPARRGRPPKAQSQSRKGKARQTVVESDENEEEETPIHPRQYKRSGATSIPRVRLKMGPQKGKGKEREDEDKGMFDDLLKEEERDITHTSITNADIQRFQRSRDVAESKLVTSARPSHPDPPDTPIAGPSSRPLRSSTQQQISAAVSTSPAVSTPAPTTPTPQTLRIRSIRFGPYEIQTWFDAPFPEEYANIPDGRLWICEFCLKYMKSQFGAGRHRTKCKARHPPGDEIYRDGAVSIFEVDGRKNKIYCQNLCLLSKMYLDHKSLFYDVEPFLFYVMTETDDVGARFVGYFSKEKRSPKDYNVSCIMTLPVRQRKGWGNLLIDFSYLLSKKEKRTGSPEKPLSGLGALGYRNYWTLSLMRYLEMAPDKPLLEDISAATSMTIEDIHTTLVQQGMIYERPSTPPPVRPSPGQSIKFPRGRKNGIARRHLARTQSVTNEKSAEEDPEGPFVPPRSYEIVWDRERVHDYLTNWDSKGYFTLKPEKLKWSPFFLNNTKKTEALEAVDTDKLVAASKIAHHLQEQEQEQEQAEKAVVQEEQVMSVVHSGAGTPQTLFDDDVVVQRSPPSATLMDVDTVLPVRASRPEEIQVAAELLRLGVENGGHGVDITPKGAEGGVGLTNEREGNPRESSTNHLFTPTPTPEREPESERNSRGLSIPHDSTTKIVANANGTSNGLDPFQSEEAIVLKEITPSQKTVEDVVRITPVKRRGRPRKTDIMQREQQIEREEEVVKPNGNGRRLRSGQTQQIQSSPTKRVDSPMKKRRRIESPPEDSPPPRENGTVNSSANGVKPATSEPGSEVFEPAAVETNGVVEHFDVKVEDSGTPSRQSIPSEISMTVFGEVAKEEKVLDLELVDEDADGEYSEEEL